MGAFPLPLAALLFLGFPPPSPGLGVLWGRSLQGCVPRALPIGQALNQLVPSCNFLRRSF